MEHTRFPLQAYKYQPSGKRDIGRPRRRWRRNNNTRGRNRRSDDYDDYSLLEYFAV
jgi:hypothetical protein